MHQKISAHWLTDGLLDAEYKQYMMLAWLQKVKKEFRKTHLYPSLGDLVEAHRGLRQFKEERDRWGELMQGELQGLDFQKMRWVYGQIQAHPDLDAYLDDLALGVVNVLAWSAALAASAATGRLALRRFRE